MDLVSLRKALITWGAANYRDFPWRRTSDPYRLLIAEIMLHRTQASQVVPVYEKFIESYPDIKSLAQATNTDLKENLYSLGLHWRIDLIFSMVHMINEEYQGVIPSDKDKLLALPGVSEYIASALRCFAWNYPEPIIDTNTVRVVGRLYNLEVRDSTRRNRKFRNMVAEIVDPNEPRLFNYALLDLADKVCTKRKPPDCAVCPLLSACAYGSIRLYGAT